MKDDTHKKILFLTNQGEILFEKEKYKKAINKYNQAFLLIPKPYSSYEASSWVLTAIGDCYFFLQDFKKALSTFKHAEACEGGLNPFIWMRIGQCYFEEENSHDSREYLIRAYAVEGEEIFEDDNPKYLESIKDLTI